MLRLIGTPCVVDAEGGLLPALPDKAYVLIAMVILRFGGRADRLSLGHMLWPEAEDYDVRASLRNLIRLIRRWQASTGVTLLRVTERFAERAEGCAPSDLDSVLSYRFEAAPDEFAQTLQHLRGPLLAFGRAFEDAVERWIDEQRTRLDQNVRLTMFPAIEQGGAAGAAAIEVLQTLFPYDDRLCRAQMQSLAQTVGLREVVGAFEAFKLRLKQDLDAEPEAETIMLARTLTGETPPRSEIGWSTDREPAAVPRFEQFPRLMVCPPAIDPETARWRNLAQWFVDDVTLTLCDNRAFEVIAPHTANSLHNGKVLNPVEDFHLNFLVETSLKLTATGPALLIVLMAAPTRRILWADRLPISTTTALASRLQAVRTLTMALTTRIEEAVSADPVASMVGSAYIDYLVGKNRLLGLDLAEIRRGRRDLRTASRKAPDFALTYSWLARSYLMEWILLARQDRDLLERARTMAQQAIEIDPLNGSGHREYGRALFFLGDCDAAVEEIEYAVQRSPHNADLLADCADCLVHHSEIEAAADRIGRALTLNPLAPDQYFWTAGAIEFFRGNYDNALQTLLRMANPAPAARLLAATGAMAGQTAISQKYRDQVLAVYPDFNVGNWIKTIPQRDPVHREHYATALRRAGL